MTPGFEIISTVIADIARTEPNGKAILVGVYASGINFPTHSLIIPTFAVWCQFRSPANDCVCSYSITGPNGEIVASGMGPLIIQDTSVPSSFIVQLGQTTFPAVGTYKINIGFNGPQDTVGEFTVGVASPPATALKH